MNDEHQAVRDAEETQATSDVVETNGQQASEPAQEPAETLNSERLVPVSEAKRYRKRAQQAEQRVGELEAELTRSRETVAAHEQQLSDLQRRQQIDAALTEHHVIDLDAARLLAEQALADADEPDVTSVVAHLRRRKPYLFASASRAGASASGPRPVNSMGAPAGTLEHVAAEAVASGRRTDVLRYLRLRRNRS